MRLFSDEGIFRCMRLLLSAYQGDHLLASGVVTWVVTWEDTWWSHGRTHGGHMGAVKG